MKKFLKYSGIISAVVVLVGFILLIACNGVVDKDYAKYTFYNAGATLFGSGKFSLGDSHAVVVTNFNGQASGAALVAWIFSLVALIALIAGIVLPLLKVKAFGKVAGIVNLCAVVLLLTAGIVVFFTVPSFKGNNGLNSDAWTLSGGYVIAGILYIVGGAVAICPAVVDFLGKK